MDLSEVTEVTEDQIQENINNSDASVYSEENELTLHSTDSPFSLSLKIDCFHSDKQFSKFVKNVERLVRTSSEYKQWIAYIIEVLGQKACCLTHEVINECDIEIHHHPITLYTITKAVILDKLNKGMKFCTFDIAMEVIKLHFTNKVGYMPLLADIHKKYHSGFQNLPIEHVDGDYKHILNNYPIDDDEREKIYELCNTKFEDCKVNWSKDDYPGLDSNQEELPRAVNA